MSSRKSTGDKTAKRVQGSRNLKKKTSNEKSDASSCTSAIFDQSNRSWIKGKSTNSEVMKDIPFDVLLEIFRRLEPVDLLHLSRVSKSLHDLLTSNDLVFLWKSDYNNVNRQYRPPPCPDGTNIVFYTNYLYGRHCQFCLSGLGRIYHESAFVRLCSKCADNSFLSWHHTVPSIRQLCNKWLCNSTYVILKVEYNLRSEEFRRTQKEKRASYIAERGNVLRIRQSVGSVLAHWRKIMHRFHLDNLRVVRYRRGEDIMKKLEEEGHKSDFAMTRLRIQQAPHVRKSHELTDSEWGFIRADILDFLQDIRDDRAVRNMRHLLKTRISQLESFISQWRIRPTAWWVASSSEPIASFIKSGLSEQTLHSKNFEKVEPQLRDVITSWKEETDCYLATLIPQSSGKTKKQGPHRKINTLELATTFFKCYWCTEPISYPRILRHGCLFKDVKAKEGSGDEDKEADMEDPEGDMAIDARGPREPRPPKEITPDLVFPMLSDYYSLGMRAGKEGVTYDEEASTAARDIIMAYGEDPMTVTYAAMEDNDTRLECLRCSRAMQAKKKAKSVRLAMKWTMALVHELGEHYGEPPSSEPAWRKIDSLADLAKVETAEVHVKKLKQYQKSLACNYCGWVTTHPPFRLHHITSDHNVVTDEDNISKHFSPPVDMPIKMLNPAVKI